MCALLLFEGGCVNRNASVRYFLDEVDLDTLAGKSLSLTQIRSYFEKRSLVERQEVPSDTASQRYIFYPVFLCGVPGLAAVDTFRSKRDSKSYYAFRWVATDSIFAIVADTIAESGNIASNLTKWSHERIFDSLIARLHRHYAIPNRSFNNITIWNNGAVSLWDDSTIGMYVSHPLRK